MKREWEPGEVALVDSWRGKAQIAFRTVRDELGWCVLDEFDTRGLSDDEVAVARPVVVIDPDDREQVERLALITAHQYGAKAVESIEVSHLQIALREFANPKLRIEEPTGLGAVVEDEDGGLWVRVGPTIGDLHWRSTDPGNTNCFKWRAIDAVRVLSEGVVQ